MLYEGFGDGFESVVYRVSRDFVVLLDGSHSEGDPGLCGQANQTPEYPSAIAATDCGATVLDFGTLRTGVITFLCIVRCHRSPSPLALVHRPAPHTSRLSPPRSTHTPPNPSCSHNCPAVE